MRLIDEERQCDETELRSCELKELHFQKEFPGMI